MSDDVCSHCGCGWSEDDGCEGTSHWHIPTPQDIRERWLRARQSGNAEAAEAWTYLMNARREMAHLRGDIKRLSATTVNYDAAVGVRAALGKDTNR